MTVVGEVVVWIYGKVVQKISEYIDIVSCGENQVDKLIIILLKLNCNIDHFTSPL